MDVSTDKAQQTAEKLRDLLTERGIPARSQPSELSKILGVSFSGASKLLNGTVPLTPSQVQTLTEQFHASTTIFASESLADAVVPDEPQPARLVMGGRDLPAKLWLGNRIPAKSRRPKCVAIEGDEGWEVLEASDAPNVPQYFVERLELRFAESTPPKVAVVDDDAALAEGVADFLNMQGMEATAFSNPEEFVRSLEYSTWEGILLDWTLGDWTGHEVMEHISKSSSSAAPLILLTGILNTSASEEGKLAAGALGERVNAIFMSKPIDNARIVSQLRKMIWALESS